MKIKINGEPAGWLANLIVSVVVVPIILVIVAVVLFFVLGVVVIATAPIWLPILVIIWIIGAIV